MRKRCLTDEEMTSYVDGVVAEDERRKIEAHLAACPTCLHNVAELKELVRDEAGMLGPVPDNALTRAESLIALHTGERGAQVRSEFDIVAVLKGGVCRILETTGNLVTPRLPAAAAVRGNGSRTLSPRIARSISGLLVTVELRARADKVKPVLSLIDEATSQGPDGVRVQICAAGTCETRYTHEGKAEFSPVGRGTYRIDIERAGPIDLEVK